MTTTNLILLVEDEALVAFASEDALKVAGFSVVHAANGNEAMALLDQRSDIAGLVTDVRLGKGPSGWEVARHARALRPEMAVVYVTGDSANHWAAEGVPNSILVQKPYAEAQVIAALASCLNLGG